PGNYKIINKVVRPGGILGTRWMGLSIPGGIYGIHGTNNPSSIGTAASLGCIRMFNQHVEELFPRVSIGTAVTIYSRSAQNTGKAIGSAALSASASAWETQTNQEKSYTVNPGDTLWDIANKFNVPMEQLIAANNLATPDQLVPGQILLVP
ncbi:MAG: LysM peptidoglycan-binding domain-containing protein, partial [Firmicutes bacterium]|nr:LysM peptidoglycan-binding domain-containing protein [Bacillota bacterium]